MRTTLEKVLFNMLNNSFFVVASDNYKGLAKTISEKIDERITMLADKPFVDVVEAEELIATANLIKVLNGEEKV